MKSAELPDAKIQLIHEKNKENDDVFVTITLQGMKKPVTILVDSGADVSLLKIDNINDLDSINRLGIRTIGGAFNGSSKTLGIFTTSWMINKNPIKTSWQVIDNRNDIPVDGILGRDILWNRTKIDAIEKEIHVFNEGVFLITFPLVSSPNKQLGNPIKKNLKVTSVRTLDNGHGTRTDTQNQLQNYSPGSNNLQMVLWNHQPGKMCYKTEGKFILEPRTINIIQLRISEPEDTEILMNSQELCSGIFMGNSSSTVTKGFVKSIVINCNATPVVFKNHIIHYQYMTDFESLYKDNVDDSTVHNVPFMSKFNSEIHKRAAKVKEHLQVGENLSEAEHDAITTLCAQFQNLFYMEGDRLTHTTVLEHSIPLKTDQPPLHQKMYRLPPLFKEEINKQVQQLLDNDVVINSKSPWSSPLLIVPKKPGSDGQKRWRMVVDFRKLNQVTIKDAFPLPRIEDILDQ